MAYRFQGYLLQIKNAPIYFTRWKSLYIYLFSFFFLFFFSFLNGNYSKKKFVLFIFFNIFTTINKTLCILKTIYSFQFHSISFLSSFSLQFYFYFIQFHSIWIFVANVMFNLNFVLILLFSIYISLCFNKKNIMFNFIFSFLVLNY